MKVYLHVWSEGVKRNLSGSPTPVVLVRCSENLNRVYLIAEAVIDGRANLVFRPAPADRLPGFEGRVISWIETQAKSVKVRIAAGTPFIAFDRFLARIADGNVVQVIAVAKPSSAS